MFPSVVIFMFGLFSHIYNMSDNYW